MLTEMFSCLRAMRPGTRLAALLCAAVVACCLALPPVVFAVWDGMLFAGTHPRADAGQAEPLGRPGLVGRRGEDQVQVALHVLSTPLSKFSEACIILCGQDGK